MKININELEKAIGETLYTYVRTAHGEAYNPLGKVRYENVKYALKEYIYETWVESKYDSHAYISKVIKVYHSGSPKADDIYIEDQNTISLIGGGWIWNLLMEKAPQLIALYHL